MVEYIEIFGSKYPIRIGYYVMKKVKEETGKSFEEALDEVQETGDIEVHETILYAALQMGAYAEHGSMDELDVDREDIPMLLDACFADYLKLFSSDTFFPEDLQEMTDKSPRRLENNNGKAGDKKQKPKRTKKQT